MSNIQFNNCQFKDCDIHIGDNNSTEGGALLGLGLLAYPLLVLALPVVVFGSKAIIGGILVKSAYEVGTILINSRKEEYQLALQEENKMYLDNTTILEVDNFSIKDELNLLEVKNSH